MLLVQLADWQKWKLTDAPVLKWGGENMQTLGWRVSCYEDFAEHSGTISSLYGFSYSKCTSKNSSYKIKIRSQDMYKHHSIACNAKKIGNS